MDIKFNRLYFFAFIEGFIVMALELITARMLAPYYGLSIYTWGAVIGVTFISLAIGYYLGGIIADRVSKKSKLISLCWVIFISSVFIILLPFISQNLLLSFKNVNYKIAVVLLSVLLILPSLLPLGMMPTMLIRFITEKTENSGYISGTVFTVSTVGGIFSLFIMGFFIIPEFGLSTPTLIIGIFSGSIASILLIINNKIIAFAFFALIVIISLSSKEKKSISDIKILYNSEGLLGQILVADLYRNYEISGNVRTVNRIMFVNRIGQTYINFNTGKSLWSYVDYLTSVASKLPEKSNVLLLGLGGGTVAKQLQDFLKFNVDAVELDKRIAELAKKYFSLSKSTNVIIDDARHFLQNTEKTYNLIIFDVFKGEVPPAHLLTKECFEITKSKLTENGFIIVNFHGFLNGNTGKAGRSLYKTLNAAGFDVNILPTYEEEKYRNALYIACLPTQHLLPTDTVTQNHDFNNLRVQLNLFGKPVNINDLFIDVSKLNFNNALVFVDDKPILEHYNFSASKIWRDEYNKNFTQLFIENGIPLFE